MKSPISRIASGIRNQRQGDRQARAPTYQRRPRGTSQTGCRPRPRAGGGGRGETPDPATDRAASSARRGDALANGLRHTRSSTNTVESAQRRPAVQPRRQPRPRSTAVDEPIRRGGRALGLHARGIGPQPVREQRHRHAVRLSLRGALEQLADPRRRILALLREPRQLVAEHDAAEGRVQRRRPDRVDPGRPVAPPLGLPEQPGQLLRPILQLPDDRSHALVVGLEPAGEQAERAVVGDVREPADGRRQLAHHGRRAADTAARRAGAACRSPSAGAAGWPWTARRRGRAPGPAAGRGRRPRAPGPPRATRRACPRWRADPAAPSTTRHRRSRPASGARPGPARTPRASRGRRRR